jgi:hypothetical protein
MTRRGVVVTLLLVGLVSGLACQLNQDQARIRVKSMLDRWKAGGTGTGGDAQSAAMLFYTGREAAGDETIVAVASDRFDSWRKEKDLYHGISSAEIKTVEPDSATSDACKVTVSIDGTTYGMLVIPGQPIQWKD